MIRRILKWPGDKDMLHQVSAPVDFEKDKDLLGPLIDDMFETTRAVHGLGLAAIQIGVPLRVFVMDMDDKIKVAFVNPVVTLEGPKSLTSEACLSIPGVVELAERAPTARVKGWDKDGNQIEHTFTGLAAQCVQHEIEHLDGIILVDKMGPMKRDRIAAKLLKPK